jgi:outer membrane protein assembly factor BamD (BamD/ComL family)
MTLNMKQYVCLLALSVLLPCCSGKSDLALYQEGKSAEEGKNFQLAVDRYEEIVSRFQQSAYAESALYRAGLIYNNDLHDLHKAIGSYRKFCELFPSSKQAPTALFLSGFLYNNELHQLDSAKLVYETFLQKYPAHELAASAKFELETLGKDPHPLLKIDTSAEGPGSSGASTPASRR